ncbi:MAG: DUF1634 domain-containing protein, partial [Gemmatimonadales bacterium]
MTGKQLEGHDPMELVIGSILRWGVVVAAIVGALGVAGEIMVRAAATPDFRHFTGDAAIGLPAIISGVAQGHARAIMQVGIALLIATPIVRVALSLVAFARERDRTYVVITMMVLALLLYGLLGG